MTYTYKLARRLAISRDLAMLHVLVLLAACAGETTAPEAPPTSGTPAVPHAPGGFRVLPGTVTIETNQHIRFRGEMRTLRGQVFAPRLIWEASGGSIDSAGRFSAPKPGTYRIVARGLGRGRAQPQRPDTSVVLVVSRQTSLIGIRVTPRSSNLDAGETRSFTAVGRLANGGTAPIGVIWTATGGTVDPAGVYQAGSVAGTYRVIATDTRGTLADTVKVTVSAPVTPDTVPDPTPEPTPDPTPEPTPDPTPEPTPALARVVLRPATVYLATSSTHQFAAFGRTTAGDSIAIDVAFRATGGTITSTGLYTAGPTAGTYKVIATSSELADTAVVTLTPASSSGGTLGIPYGPYGAWEGTSYKTMTDVFSASIGTYSAGDILQRIETARSKRKRLIIGMTGGNHDQYKTDGVFDITKWRAKMETYNTAAIKTAVAAAVADGTIIGNNVMDEPHNTAHDNTWGPKGTMTKARVDEMCGYVKAMFPTLPVGVVHPHDVFEPTNSYRVCDFIVSQYSHRKTLGDIQRFRDEALALGRRDGHAIAFSLNILDGGIQAARDGLWNCSAALTGGRGTFDPNCRMTAQQVREWGTVLGTAGCALTMWRYDVDFMAKTENQEAFRAVAGHLATMPAKSCRRT